MVDIQHLVYFSTYFKTCFSNVDSLSSSMLLKLITPAIILATFTCSANMYAYPDSIHQSLVNFDTRNNQQGQHIKKYIKARWDNAQFITAPIVEYFLYRKEPGSLDKFQKYQWYTEDEIWINGAIKWLRKDNLYDFVKTQFDRGNCTRILCMLKTWIQDHISGKIPLVKEQYHALVYICQAIYHKDSNSAYKALELVQILPTLELQQQKQGVIDIIRSILKRLPKDLNTKSEQQHQKKTVTSWPRFGRVINPAKTLALVLDKIENALKNKHNYESNGTFKKEIVNTLCCVMALYDYLLADSNLSQLVETIIDRCYYPGHTKYLKADLYYPDHAKYLKGNNVVTLDEDTATETQVFMSSNDPNNNDPVNLKVEANPVKTPVKRTNSVLLVSESSNVGKQLTNVHPVQVKGIHSSDIPNIDNKGNTQEQDTAGTDGGLKELDQNEHNMRIIKEEITDNQSVSIGKVSTIVTSADLAQGTIKRKVKHNILNKKLKHSVNLISKLAKIKLLQPLNLTR